MPRRARPPVRSAHGHRRGHPEQAVELMYSQEDYVINGHSLGNVRNRTEPRVIDAIRRALSGSNGFCGCQLCVEDVYAAALNVLPAHYVQSGSMLVRREGPRDEEIDSAVAKAIRRVQAHPNHP